MNRCVAANDDSVGDGRNSLPSGRLPKSVIGRFSGAGFAEIAAMHNPHATSPCLDGCDLSWTTGMPVHPEPAPVSPVRLPRKDLREMVVLAAVCVISTIVFVPPLAGVLRSPEQSALASRDLQFGASLVSSPKSDAIAVAAAATPAIASRAVPAASRTRPETPRSMERRPLGTRISRALTGDGRHRVQPFPRPAE
jgi:hypothetical protein